MTPRKGASTSRKNRQSPYHRRRKVQALTRHAQKVMEHSVREAQLRYAVKPEEKVQSASPSPLLCQGFDVPPLRDGIYVLSLFDGISTALLALDNLRIHVCKYFSSEIDYNALKVQRCRFGDRITRLGSVKGLTDPVLENLGRVDLLIGGSPCSDLTLLNPRRRGLRGEGSTGLLFFNFVQIRNFLSEKARKNGHEFWWLFENTAHMEIEVRSDISSELGLAPVVRDACHYLPVHRKRLFWGNLENMSQPPKAVTALTLEEILGPKRSAAVQLVPTLTTTSHSQKKGKDKMLPVLEDGEFSSLLITEVEHLFGFPEHFTDCDLQIGARRKLLGKAFCVPVIEELLSPLQMHFWERPEALRSAALKALM